MCIHPGWMTHAIGCQQQKQPIPPRDPQIPTLNITAPAAVMTSINLHTYANLQQMAKPPKKDPTH
eukprot:4427878-Ditylum_brightwellii.AAC.1